MKIDTRAGAQRKNCKTKYGKVECYRKLIIAFLKTKDKATFEEIRVALGENFNIDDARLISTNVVGIPQYFKKEYDGRGIAYYSLK